MLRRLLFVGWAHPRWRGEDPLAARPVRQQQGSSPLARGGRDCMNPKDVEDRLIPAGAGRTTGAAIAMGVLGAHPRWRGEDVGTRGKCSAGAGSSPLARGGLSWPSLWNLARRLIPAGAGRTPRALASGPCPSAHPRWRGEDGILVDGVMAGRGSSPLARGGRSRGYDHDETDGLIPAGAGRTSSGIRAVRSRTAHPRWRGEDYVSPFGDVFNLGSSPLARGGPAHPRRPARPARLIPAGAGRTPASVSGRGAWPAHPRWRGEDLLLPALSLAGNGSSPLARGGPDEVPDKPSRPRLIPAGAGRTFPRLASFSVMKAHPRWRGEDLGRGRVRRRRGGLIPAGAGRTGESRCRPGRSPAHPRWRGEDALASLRASASRGSSPLARGGRCLARMSTHRSGLIPAGAGRTQNATEEVTDERLIPAGAGRTP